MVGRSVALTGGKDCHNLHQDLLVHMMIIIMLLPKSHDHNHHPEVKQQNEDRKQNDNRDQAKEEKLVKCQRFQSEGTDLTISQFAPI